MDGLREAVGVKENIKEKLVGIQGNVSQACWREGVCGKRFDEFGRGSGSEMGEVQAAVE